MTHCYHRWLKLWKEMRKECCFHCSHHKIWETVVCRAVLLSYSWIIQKIQWEPLLIQYYLNLDQSQNAKYAEAGGVYTSFKFCTSVVLCLNINTGKRKAKQNKRDKATHTECMSCRLRFWHCTWWCKNESASMWQKLHPAGVQVGIHVIEVERKG